MQIGRRVLVLLSSGESRNGKSSLASVTQSLSDEDVEIWAVHGGKDSSNYLTDVVSQPSHLLSSLDGESGDFIKNFVMSVCSCEYIV